MNVNFEAIIRGHKSDIFEVYNPFHICRIQLQKKKSGVKKCLEICAIKGGVGRLMANTILNFHFDYPLPSLMMNLIQEEEYERGHWGSKAEFLLSCIGYSVGIGWLSPSLLSLSRELPQSSQ